MVELPVAAAVAGDAIEGVDVGAEEIPRYADRKAVGARGRDGRRVGRSVVGDNDASEVDRRRVDEGRRVSPGVAEIERDEQYERSKLTKDETDICHKEFITWREFLTYFDDYRDVEDRNLKST